MGRQIVLLPRYYFKDSHAGADKNVKSSHGLRLHRFPLVRHTTGICYLVLERDAKIEYHRRIFCDLIVALKVI